MRYPERSRGPVLWRSPGIACMVFDEAFDNAGAARRLFNRVARDGAAFVIVDMRHCGGLSSATLAAILNGARGIAKSGGEVTVFVNLALRRLLELSRLDLVARVVFIGGAQAA
jgi:anti-anti-sigma regulatory factor